jgi:hypothetical protein
MALTTKEKYTACAVVGALIILVIVYHMTKKEGFQNLGRSSDLPDCIYSIRSSKSKLPLSTNFVDLISCNDFTLGETKRPTKVNWKLKRVAQSVYIFFKEGEKECLYTHASNTPRSYYFPSCDAKNLCGLETPTYEGTLDGDSLRTYFMILQHPSGKFYIKSMKNDMYLQMINDRPSFSKNPNENCLFDFKKV